MTSPTPEGALAIERARGDDRAQIRAEGFRAGAEAMREAAAALADRCAAANGAMAGMRGSNTPVAVGKARNSEFIRDKIRSLPIPEMPSCE